MDVWSLNYFRLFISHTSKHASFCAGLKIQLIKGSISGFVAHTDIEPTAEWQDTIEYAMNTCDALVALVSPDFIKSKWCDQEVGFALGRGVLVIPVMVDADPHGFMGKYQGLKGSGKNFDQIASGIERILVKHPKSSPRMTEVLVGQFENSNTFNEAKVNMSILEELDHIPELLIKRILTASESNDQIASSFGVPTRARTLAAKHRKK
jgi:hypothetical protein